MSEYDYTIEIPGEFIGPFRELLRAAIDAAGEDEQDLVDLGKEILAQFS
jgi:hypothetical protein